MVLVGLGRLLKLDNCNCAMWHDRINRIKNNSKIEN